MRALGRVDPPAEHRSAPCTVVATAQAAVDTVMGQPLEIDQ